MKTFAIVALCAAVSGCATSTIKQGVELKPEMIAQLKPGESTKADVRKIFGEPTDREIGQGQVERWTYMRVEVTARAGFGGVSSSSMKSSSIKMDFDGDKLTRVGPFELPAPK